MRRLIACPRCYDRSGRSSSCSPCSRSGPWPLRPRRLRACRAPAGWPVAGSPRVVGGFDPPAVRWGAGHRGVDLAASRGDPVLAAAAGTVHFAGRVGGKPVVSIDHGGVRTTYEPVQAMVLAGQRVAMGQLIGRVSQRRPLRAALPSLGTPGWPDLSQSPAADPRGRHPVAACRRGPTRRGRPRSPRPGRGRRRGRRGRDLRRPGRAGGQSRLHPSGVRRHHLPVRDAVPSGPQALEAA